jgi:hypothetical protein
VRTGFECEFLSAVRTAKGAFDDIRPAGIIFDVCKIGKGRELNDLPILDDGPQPPDEPG